MGNFSKSFALLLTISIIISSSIVAETVQLGLAQTGANVSGTLDLNTFWTKANSPYNLVGNVLVNKGVTLTIESGATINLNSYYMEVNGSLTIQQGATINMEKYYAYIEVNGALDAVGTAANPIFINGFPGFEHGLLFPIYPSINFGQTSSESTIENAVINSTHLRAYNSVKLNNNTLMGGAGMAFSGGSALLTNNYITKVDIALLGGSAIISNNIMKQSSITLHAFNDNNAAVYGTINGNIISDISILSFFNQVGITLNDLGASGQVTIEKNIITGNYKGIDINSPNSLGSSVIRDNLIVNNSIGIVIENLYSPIILNNNIYGNSYLYGTNGYNMELQVHASNIVNATYNWWGTTDAQAIKQSIYDSKNDSSLGTVNFVPFLTSPNIQAPSFPTLTTTPNPTIAPSTSNPPTVTIPEWLWLVIVPLLLSIFAVAVALRYRKTTKLNVNYMSKEPNAR